MFIYICVCVLCVLRFLATFETENFLFDLLKASAEHVRTGGCLSSTGIESATTCCDGYGSWPSVDNGVTCGLAATPHHWEVTSSGDRW